MKTVQLVQLNNNYGNQVYLPYSVGILKSVVDADKNIASKFKFRDFVFLRENLDLMVEKIGHVDILGISCYVWNWALSTRLAAKVREKNPECVIILGGPQVPNNIDNFFEKHPCIDLVCHGEGELTVHEIFSRIANSESLAGIPGTSYHERTTGTVYSGGARERIKDLDIIPSPYLEGTFDDLLSQPEYRWMVTWETNRGCPFKCTFCDWGSAIATKVRKFNEQRLLDEIDYFSEKKINLVFGADANFGIFKRDKEFALRLAKNKSESGYPDQFRVCFTKNTTDRIFELAQIFSNAGMNKGVSVSMQSLNVQSLKDIKRSNIRLNVFKDLQKKYIAAGLVTYTELILPLPGETYESFKAGIDALLDNAQHSGIVIYNCTIMPNAEMGEKSYQEEYGFDMVEIPIFQAHSSKKTDDIVEKETVVVGTSTMPREKWRQTYKFAWAIQCFHLLGLLQVVAISLRHKYGIPYSEFYEGFLTWSESQESSLIASELHILDGLLDGVFTGSGFDQYVPEFEEISWPAEEASFLRLSSVLDKFYEEVSEFIFATYGTTVIDDSLFVSDLIEYQRNVIVGWHDEVSEFELQHNIHEYFNDLRAGKLAELRQERTPLLRIPHKNYEGDKTTFSREIVWYGRKGGKFFNEISLSELSGVDVV